MSDTMNDYQIKAQQMQAGAELLIEERNRLQEEVTRLQRARIGDAEIIGRWQCQAEALQRENERLKAAVSDEEWFRNSYQVEGEHVGKLVMDRVDIEDLIASRATQPATQELFNCTCQSDVLGRCVVHKTSGKRDVQSPMAGGESREKPAPQSTENGK